jgi:glycosyltransferase involved in cell wall biosynthesis
LIRVSQWLPAEKEPTELAAEFHVALTTSAMAAVFASSDIFLGPSRSEEGFGLPAAEAMASGVPAILSEIPSFLSWSEQRDHALFFPEGDGVSLGRQLVGLLDDNELKRSLAERGRDVVEQFRAAETGRRLAQWFESRA